MINNVLIGIHNYKILTVKNKVDDEKSPLCAEIDFDNATIEIDETQKGTFKLQALLHEIVHAMDNLYTFNFSEETTDRLASALLILVKDNPKLINYMKEELYNGRESGKAK